MDVKEALRTGLTSSPKFLPLWYRYDKQGSLYNDMCLTENPYYYLHKTEIVLLKENLQVCMVFQDNYFFCVVVVVVCLFF